MLVNAQSGEGKSYVRGSLLDAVTATNSGTWQALGDYTSVSVTVAGSFVGTVKILVSNTYVKPADSDNNHAQLGSDITVPNSVTIEKPYRWIKARVSAYTSGTIQVDAVSRPQ